MGATSPTVTIKATGVADSTKSATVTLALLPITVQVSNPPTSLNAGSSYTFQAQVGNDAQSRGATWSITSCNNGASSCGTINATTGAFTTTTTTSIASPSVTIQAASVGDGTKLATATLPIVPLSGALQVQITNPRVSLGTGETYQFQSSVINDPQNQGVSWSLDTCHVNGQAYGST